MPIDVPVQDDDASQMPITQLLQRWGAGDVDARTELLGLVYQQVHKIAERAIRAEPGATLSPTELSNEALLRLLVSDADFQDRKHFFSVIATATRQVLIDAARKRMAQKRGGASLHLSLEHANDVQIDRDPDTVLLRLDQALAQLAAEHPRRGQLIEMLYFGGFTQAQLAQATDLSITTVERDVRFAKAWLKKFVGP